MSKAPIKKNDAPEHIVGRTAWDAVSEAFGFVKLYAHLIIILGLATFTIYKFYEITAAAQHENVKRLNEFGALLNQVHETAGKLRSSQVADLERQFDLTGKAMERSEKAKQDAEKFEANAKRASEKAAEFEAKVKETAAKAAEADAKAKEALAVQTSKLASKQNDLDRVKGNVLDLARVIREERWPDIAGPLNSLLMEAGTSFDRRIESALRNLQTPAPSPGAGPGLDTSLLANPIAPPKIERQLSPTLIAQIQRTLCIEVDGVIGDEDSETRAVLMQFFEGYDYKLAPDESRSRGAKGAKALPSPPLITPLQRLSPMERGRPKASAEPLPYIIDTPERLAAISAAVDRYENCKKHGLKNAFEVGLFSHLGEKQINNAISKAASLAKIPVKETGKKWTTTEMRQTVEKLRNSFDLNSEVDAKDVDTIDSDLLSSMYEASQGRQPILPRPALTEPRLGVDGLPCGQKPLDEAARVLLTFVCPTNRGINSANRGELEKLRPDLTGKILTVLTEDTPAQKQVRADLKNRFEEAGLGKQLLTPDPSLLARPPRPTPAVDPSLLLPAARPRP
jgi:hypothetical protein